MTAPTHCGQSMKWFATEPAHTVKSPWSDRVVTIPQYELYECQRCGAGASAEQTGEVIFYLEESVEMSLEDWDRIVRRMHSK